MGTLFVPAKALPHNVSRATAVVTTPLHRLHSGHLGDYVAWLMVGAAVIVGLVVLG